MSKSPPKVGMVSLGCPKALVDSENILTELTRDGYQITGNYEDADVVVVNTCGFIDSAKQESLDAIEEAVGANGKVIVTGCMGLGEDAKKIKQLNPKVLSVSGPADVGSVVNAVNLHLPAEETSPPHFHHHAASGPGIKLTPKHYAYLKISEGCNHRCSFCIIPSMRGDLVSRPIDEVYHEAEQLVANGVKELLVVSQDTSAYGVDTRYKLGFIDGQAYETRMLALAEALSNLNVWTRLHYVYPYPHVDKLIPLMAEGKILPYLDIPFQHASPAVLKKMKRPGNIDNLSDRIHNWRDQCPDLTIRSTFIVGFPGETDADFESLLQWLETAQIDRAGCFKYSAVDGASANALPDHVDEGLKEERWQRLMALQQEISAKRLQRRVGHRETVMIDGVDDTQDRLIARSRSDAPEIDGLVYVEADGDFQLGDMIEVTIDAADEYDLYATHIPDAQPTR